MEKENILPRYHSPFWKSHFYQLQKEAPIPISVLCNERMDNSPDQYGLVFHGAINHHACDKLLCKDGQFLIRCSQSSFGGQYTLSFRFCGKVKHYKLHYDGRHYVGEKKFTKLEDLVADGLVTLHLELKAGNLLHQLPSTNYRQSPYFTLTRSFRKGILQRKVEALKKQQVESDCSDSQYGIIKKSDDMYSKLPEVLSSSSDNSMIEESDMNYPHRFQNHTFTGLHWCGFCGNFLWGFMLQGAKCQDCGFKAHYQCSLKVPNDCCPDLKDLCCIFGMDLSTSLQMSPFKDLSPSPGVPPLVSDCIAEIEARGLTSEGIYRVSGSLDQIDHLRLSYERDWNNVSLKEKTVPDINVVAGLLKLYFRQLPLCLITDDCFKKLVDASQLSAPDGKNSNVGEALDLLPISHYLTLKMLIKHLSRVCEYSSFNKMTATSLGTIFGPTLVQMDSNIEGMQVSDLLTLKISAQEPRIVEMLIILHREIFPDDDT